MKINPSIVSILGHIYGNAHSIILPSGSFTIHQNQRRMMAAAEALRDAGLVRIKPRGGNFAGLVDVFPAK